MYSVIFKVPYLTINPVKIHKNNQYDFDIVLYKMINISMTKFAVYLTNKN